MGVDDLVVEALKEGFKQAQGLINSCNMAPSIQAKNRKWFTDPWLLESEDKTFMSFKPAARPVQGEDGDGEVMREDVRVSVEAQIESPLGDEVETSLVFDDSIDLAATVEDEVRGIVNEMISSASQENVIVQNTVPFSSTVKFEDNIIFKSTLVSQLNVNPFLSKDRLTRVKSSVYFNNSESYLAAANSSSTCFVGVGTDVGVYFVQRISTTQSSAVKAVQKRNKQKGGRKGMAAPVTAAVDQGLWYLGRIQRMKVKKGNSWGRLNQPVDLMNKPSITIAVHLNYFSRAPGHLKFKYDLTDSIWVDLETLISSVTMSYNEHHNVYTLDANDAEALAEFISNNK